MELWEKGKVYAWAWLWGLPAAAQPGRDGAPVGPIRRESWERPAVIVAGEFRLVCKFFSCREKVLHSKL